MHGWGVETDDDGQGYTGPGASPSTECNVNALLALLTDAVPVTAQPRLHLRAPEHAEDDAVGTSPLASSAGQQVETSPAVPDLPLPFEQHQPHQPHQPRTERSTGGARKRQCISENSEKNSETKRHSPPCTSDETIDELLAAVLPDSDGDGNANTACEPPTGEEEAASLKEIVTNLPCLPAGRKRDLVSMIFDIGLRESSPKVLIGFMPHTEGTGLTTEHLKSHLQKFRLRQERSKAECMDHYESSMVASFEQFYDSQAYLKFLSELHQRKVRREPVPMPALRTTNSEQEDASGAQINGPKPPEDQRGCQRPGSVDMGIQENVAKDITRKIRSSMSGLIKTQLQVSMMLQSSLLAQVSAVSSS